MKVTLTALRATAGDFVEAVFEISNGEDIQTEKFTVSVTQCADIGLKLGECDERLFDTVMYASMLNSAVNKALSMLNYGGCSERKLVRKLIDKGFSREISEEAVSELYTLGYFDPAENACREAERCVAKLWGRRRIIAGLKEKGYSDEAIRKALARLRRGGVDYIENCAMLIRRKYRVVPSESNEIRKMIAAIMRYGYTLDEIKEAVERV